MQRFIVLVALLLAKHADATCRNDFRNNVVRFTGDWPMDLGATANWLGNEPRGEATFHSDTCLFTLTVTGLKANQAYEYKV